LQQGCKNTVDAYDNELFQSLSGVLGVCNTSAVVSVAVEDFMFQSLSGVLGVCNAYFSSRPEYQLNMFQSLSGVLGVCNPFRKAFSIAVANL